MKLVITFLVYFAIVLIIGAIVTYFFSLIVHGAGAIDWGVSFTFAVIFAIVFSWMNVRERRKRK